MLYNICDGITTARLQSSYSKNSLLINITHTYLSLYMEILLEGQTSIAYTCKKAVNFQTSGVKHAVFVIKISICNPIFNFFQLAERGFLNWNVWLWHETSVLDVPVAVLSPYYCALVTQFQEVIHCEVFTLWEGERVKLGIIIYCILEFSSHFSVNIFF